jgi:hypothetical protein
MNSMNKLLIDVTEGGFNLIITDGSSEMPISTIDGRRAAMLMGAGVKLKQSELAGEFLARFLDGE